VTVHHAIAATRRRRRRNRLQTVTLGAEAWTMVAVDRTPVVGASLILVNTDVPFLAVEAGAADDVEILTTICGNPARIRRKLCIGADRS
jgi:hypothetical protein